MIWSCPVITLDRLIFNIMWTAWIVIGTYLEDRDLHYEFGDQYREYSSLVPMLIPYRILRNKSVDSAREAAIKGARNENDNGNAA
jgi:hypothetical protein